MEEGGRFSSGATCNAYQISLHFTACNPVYIFACFNLSLWDKCDMESDYTKVQILARFLQRFLLVTHTEWLLIQQWLNELWVNVNELPIQTLVFTQTTGKLAPVWIATAWHIMHALFCFLRPLAETNRGCARKHLKAGKGLLHACTCSFNIKINIATHCGAWKKQQQNNEKLTVWLLQCKFMLSDQNDTLQSR